MATPVGKENIFIGFGWQGPRSWDGGRSTAGGFDLGRISLVFDRESKVSVVVPENVQPSIVQPVHFECSSTAADFLKVSIERIRNLTLLVRFFEQSQEKGPAFSDPRDPSGKITRPTRYRRVERVVGVEMPEEWKIGQVYRLVVTSSSDRSASLAARFLQEEGSASIEDDKKEVGKEGDPAQPSNCQAALVRDALSDLRRALAEKAKLAERPQPGARGAAPRLEDVMVPGIDFSMFGAQRPVPPESRVGPALPEGFSGTVRDVEAYL